MATNQERKENLTNPNSSPEEKEMKAKRRYYGKIFVGLIFFLIIYEYYVYVYLIMWTKLNNSNSIQVGILLIIFHFLLFMMLWGLIVTMNTHPGEIPLYWGFYIGDEDYKRKRYCLICNAFKPERSHHCSICNICVLNMDHHCPWVDNCIGFYNRKYFMQLLFYFCVLTIFIDFSLAYDVYLILTDIVNMKLKYNHHLRAAAVIVGYGIVFTLSILITMFIKFHINLVCVNTTTIESLDKEHASEYKKFNLTRMENWKQVFGDNVCLWFFPIITESGRPGGDGLTWKIATSESFINNNAGGNTNQTHTPNHNPNLNVKPNVELKNYQSNYGSNANQYNSTNPFSPKII